MSTEPGQVHITFDELRAKLADLEEVRELAYHELEALEGHRARLRNLEQNADMLLEHYADKVPEALKELVAEECHRLYKMLRLEITVQPSAILEVNGTFGAGGELSHCELHRM